MDGRTAAATLGVGPRATRAEIRQAFRARAKVLHPDAGPAGSSERFIALRRAVERLMAEAPERVDAAPGMSTSPSAAEAPVAGTAGATWFTTPVTTTSPRSDRAAAIDLTDSVRRTARTAARPDAGSGAARRPVTRDARGLSFEDHLAAALARR